MDSKRLISNKADFKALFDEYYGALCNFAYRYVPDRDVCEDLVQSVFIRLWENRASMEISRSMRSYLFTSTRNAALDHLRSKKRHDEYVEQTEGREAYTEVETDEAGRLLFRHKLFEAIRQLKPKTQEIFVLHKIEGLTYKEIAEHLEIPKRTVEYNIYTALTQLKEKLQVDYDKYIAS